MLLAGALAVCGAVAVAMLRTASHFFDFHAAHERLVDSGPPPIIVEEEKVVQKEPEIQQVNLDSPPSFWTVDQVAWWVLTRVSWDVVLHPASQKDEEHVSRLFQEQEIHGRALLSFVLPRTDDDEVICRQRKHLQKILDISYGKAFELHNHIVQLHKDSEAGWYNEENAAIRHLFDQIDEDGSGELDHNEVANLLQKLGEKVTQKTVQECILEMEDGKPSNNLIDKIEFIQWWHSDKPMARKIDKGN